MATKPKQPWQFDSIDKVKRFQKENGLSVDGIWGSKSQAAFERYSKPGAGWLDARPLSGTTIARTPAAPKLAESAMSDGAPLPTGGNTDWLGKAGSIADSLAPFASNIVNSFRKPPVPKAPTLASPVTLGKVDYSADRAATESAVRGADLAAERGLDGNTAAAVRASSLATKLGAISRINQNEANENTQIGNRQTMINSEIGMRNNMLKDNYNNTLTEMEIADQNQKGANLANAADKYIAIKNQDKARALEEKKFNITSRLFDNSGVMNRFLQDLREKGITDPTNTKRVSTMLSLGGKIKN